MVHKDLAGLVFGKLTVIAFSHTKKWKSKSGTAVAKAYWKCRCECNNIVVAPAGNLRCGHTTSCGCVNSTHGKSSTPEYRIWATMKDRCYNKQNKKFHLYGGRGISVCDRWLNSFENFIADMGPRPSRHTIERLNGDYNYSPSNCKWATYATQSRNMSTNCWVAFGGKTQIITDWARELGINENSLYARIYRLGWSVEQALTTPIGQRR